MKVKVVVKVRCHVEVHTQKELSTSTLTMSVVVLATVRPSLQNCNIFGSIPCGNELLVSESCVGAEALYTVKSGLAFALNFRHFR